MHHASPLFPFHPASNPIRAGTDFKNDYDVLAAGYTAAYGEFTATTGLTLPELLARAHPQPSATLFHTSGPRLLTTRPNTHRGKKTAP